MKVVCRICGWEGTESDLVGKYFPNPTLPGDVVKEIICPECGNQPGLDYLEEQSPKVLNKRTDNIPLDAIYVGRPSKWGNPYAIGRDGTREEVIARYRIWLETMIYDFDILHRRLNIEELRGKDLVCWCSPLPCHADVLLELANA